MKRLLLLGGGHSHVEVIRRLGGTPPPGTRVLLISPDRYTPYSGMLPGLVAGHYTFGESHIDLAGLCGRENTAFHCGQAVAIDPQRKAVTLRDGTILDYDVVSINIGSTPPAAAVPGAREHAVHVRPVSRFLKAWDSIREAAARSGRVPRIAVIGGGAGGVELSLAMDHWLRRSGRVEGSRLVVITEASAILPGHAARAARILERILAERDITVRAGVRVVAVEPRRLHTVAGDSFEADHLIWATGASAPAWIEASGIGTDSAGFVVVNPYLQSVSHPDIFAAGDVASMAGQRLPKSGVYAVRQGPPLAVNLRQALAGGELRAYKPQANALALIGTGNRYAVASYGRLAFEGSWVWRWKERIDRRFMRDYAALCRQDDGRHGCT